MIMDKIAESNPSILVMLDMQMDGPGMLLLERIKNRPPIVFGFLGYPGTTGCRKVDYIVLDNRVAPVDLAPQTAYTEQIAFMPKSCYVGSHKTLCKQMTYQSIKKTTEVNPPFSCI